MKDHVVAICAYKESPFLEKCIISLERQTVSSDIIMITSTPNEYITGLSKKYEIPLYINEYGGIVEDWNFAYEKADAGHVTITHQDDIYFPTYTETVLKQMQEERESIIGFTDYVEIREGKIIRSNKLLRIKRLMLIPLRIKAFRSVKWIRRAILAFGCPICCPSVTFSKKKISGAPFTPGFRSDEDWEAWERLSRMKGAFIYVSKQLVGHRIHQESETTKILNDNVRSEEDYIMFKKFWPGFIARKLTKIYSTSEKSNDL